MTDIVRSSRDYIFAGRRHDADGGSLASLMKVINSQRHRCKSRASRKRYRASHRRVASRFHSPLAPLTRRHAAVENDASSKDVTLDNDKSLCRQSTKKKSSTRPASRAMRDDDRAIRGRRARRFRLRAG